MRPVEESPNGATDTEAEAPYRTIAEIWTAVLAPIEEQRKKYISMSWAIRVVERYQEVHFADMPLFHTKFYAKAQRMADLLADQIATDGECLKRISKEEDALLNGGIYRSVLVAWQKEFMTWELAWDPARADAAVEVAAISEIHRMFFAPEGLISLLDEIELEFTEADRDALTAELEDLQEAMHGHR